MPTQRELAEYRQALDAFKAKLGQLMTQEAAKGAKEEEIRTKTTTFQSDVQQSISAITAGTMTAEQIAADKQRLNQQAQEINRLRSAFRTTYPAKAHLFPASDDIVRL